MYPYSVSPRISKTGVKSVQPYAQLDDQDGEHESTFCQSHCELSRFSPGSHVLLVWLQKWASKVQCSPPRFCFVLFCFPVVQTCQLPATTVIILARSSSKLSKHGRKSHVSTPVYYLGVPVLSRLRRRTSHRRSASLVGTFDTQQSLALTSQALT